MPRITVTHFTVEHLEAAGALLAERHQAHRAAEPLLAARYADPTITRAEVAHLFQQPGISGAVALVDGAVVGYLLGGHRPKAPADQLWVEAAGHAVRIAEHARDLYAHAAERWVGEGLTAHHVLLPATDAPLVDAWFRLGFGQQHVHALREAPAVSPVPLPAGTVIRPATRRDLDALAELDLLLPEHQGRSPVFSAGPPLTLAEARAEWEESLDDPAYAAFIAEADGEILGSAVGCSVELSSAHSRLARPEGAGLLSFAAVRPHARGRGLGLALGGRVLEWAYQAGYRTVVTDWRATNLLSSRTWPRLGFRPTFLRLHRAIR